LFRVSHRRMVVTSDTVNGIPGLPGAGFGGLQKVLCCDPQRDGYSDKHPIRRPWCVSSVFCNRGGCGKLFGVSHRRMVVTSDTVNGIPGLRDAAFGLSWKTGDCGKLFGAIHRQTVMGTSTLFVVPGMCHPFFGTPGLRKVLWRVTQTKACDVRHRKRHPWVTCCSIRFELENGVLRKVVWCDPRTNTPFVVPAMCRAYIGTPGLRKVVWRVTQTDGCDVRHRKRHPWVT